MGKPLTSENDMSDRIFKTGKHYKLTSKDGEATIAYFYNNPDFHMDPNGDFDENKDYSEKGFGFNIADGGGFLPLFDLTESSVIEELEFTIK
jgi:hypothetical protein